MNRLVNIWCVGQVSYGNGLRLQKYVADLHHKVTSNTVKDTLLFVEHPPVYTIGIRTKNYTDEDKKRLKALGKYLFKKFTIIYMFLLLCQVQNSINLIAVD